MDRDELKDKVVELAKEADAAGELATAGVLYSLASSMAIHRELALFEKCVPFCKAVIKHATAPNN